MNHPRRRPRALAAAVALTAVAATAVAPTAASAATTGATTIDLGGAVARSLRSQGVTISARRPARATRTKITLPVAAGRVANAATLDHRGSVTFRTRSGRTTRTATFTSWQTKLAPRRSTITAKLGRKRVPLFVLTFPRRARASADTVRLTTSTVRLTAQGARTLRRQLDLRTLPAGVIGRAKVDASVDNGSTGGPNTGGGNTGGGGGGNTGTTPTNPNPTTPTPTTPTTPTPPRVDPRCQGFDIGPVPEASPALTRTATASNVATQTFWWRPKDSWTRYISSGTATGDGVIPSAGATAGAPEVLPGSSAALVYRYGFTLNPAASWYDTTTNQGVLHYTGQVRFKWASHMIDIAMKDPEVQLDGARGRVVFRFAGTECTNYGDKRVEFTTFTTGALSGASLPQTLTEGGNTAFGGMYSPGSDWGTIDLSVTTG